MAAIKDILQLDLEDDIKNVIDLEDQSDNEIQSEIESYIITDGLGEHLTKFISQYTGNIKETGVWLSGFYGSGKSYFGKMLGYIIDNQNINGTSARDRFIPRLRGVKNEGLIESSIRKLDSIDSRVILLDAAKQNTDNGFAFTLFTKFLKKLGFRTDRYGYMEYDLLIDGKYEFLREKAKEIFGEDWDNVKKSNRKVAMAMRKVFLAMDYSEEDYNDTLDVYSNAIQSFSAESLKEEIAKYLKHSPEETLVFIFDETSEAVKQKKFTLLDLEGISEALSTFDKRVWTIAIAQEKLDDVISNENVTVSQLTKVTDRFKTKIHLESTEVDKIIRSRLLLKKDKAFKDLVNFYKENDGLISDATNLKSSFPTKTSSADEFATYYPFHKYQFHLLQKFLFSSNALVSNQIAARGMIITTFDILRKELRNRETYCFTTAYDICTEAQTAPPTDLVNKYHNAKLIIENEGLNLNGEHLMKTIHFINESELVSGSLENITKLYITDTGTYYEFKPEVEKALNLLVESKILLVSNNHYQITSDLEGKILEEMSELDIPLFVKKRELVNYLKTSGIFKPVSTITEDSVTYNFNIKTDLGDEIVSANNENLNFTTYSLFNINEDRQDFIEHVKFDTQNAKGLISLVPDNSKFKEIDKLLEEVQKYVEIERMYGNDSDSEKRRIVDRFASIKTEKEKDLINLITAAYQNGSIIYLFDENLLNPDNFKGNINETERKLIKNVYTKRLSRQLSETDGQKILRERSNEKLHKYFSSDEFKFFDSNGNFVGENLKLIDELSRRLSNFIDGKSLEEEYTRAPWGYSYGTISTALAVLFRAGRLVVKFNDTPYFSYQDTVSHEVFTSGAKFKNARFKAITKSLSASQKNEVVQALLDLEYEKHTEKKIDWNASDFDVADAITILAETLISKVNTLRKSQNRFDKLFPSVAEHKPELQKYSSKTTEGNYIQKSEDFLNAHDDYKKAVKTILKAEKFINRNLSVLNGYERFVIAVNEELKKTDISNSVIEQETTRFEKAMQKDVMLGFGDLQSAAQKIKDEYYGLMKSNARTMSDNYKSLLADIKNAKKDLQENYPAELNKANLSKLESLAGYAENRIVEEIKMEFHIKCQNSNYSLTDIINYKALAPQKANELFSIKSNFTKEPLPDPDPGKPKKITLKVDKKVMTAAEYRRLLTYQLHELAGLEDDKEIELTINNMQTV
jgi:hypothetical protein